MLAEQVTGTHILRNALKARKQSYAVIARDELQIPAEHLAAFMAGQRTLPPEILQKLALYLFNGAAEYLPALDRLRSTNAAPAVKMAVYPPPFDPAALPKHTIPQGGPQPVKPVKPVPPQPKAKRAGWVE